MSWALTIILGISWAGVGQVIQQPMPDEETCFKSLATLRMDREGAPNVEEAEVVAFCHPIGGD